MMDDLPNNLKLSFSIQTLSRFVHQNSSKKYEYTENMDAHSSFPVLLEWLFPILYSYSLLRANVCERVWHLCELDTSNDHNIHIHKVILAYDQNAWLHIQGKHQYSLLTFAIPICFFAFTPNNSILKWIRLYDKITVVVNTRT